MKRRALGIVARGLAAGALWGLGFAMGAHGSLHLLDAATRQGYVAGVLKGWTSCRCWDN